MSNIVLLGKPGRERIKKGIDTVAEAVSATLGAAGRTVIIQSEKPGVPHITKDGVTVARSITLSDPIENMGAELLKEVAGKTVDTSGDGTTTATVLAHSLITEGLKAVEDGANPIQIKNGIEDGAASAIGFLKQIARIANTPELLTQIATISANNDEFIGGLIGKAFGAIGLESYISIDQSLGEETKLEILEGMKIRAGFLNAGFVTNQARQQAVLVDPLILVTDRKITKAKEEIIPILNIAAQLRRPLLIIGEGLEGEALNTVVANFERGVVLTCFVKIHDFDDARRAISDDVCMYTGSTPVREAAGRILSKVTPDMLGTAAKVIVTATDCTIIGGGMNEEIVNSWCEGLRSQIQDAEIDFDKERLKARLASLQGKVATLTIGGFTEAEIREKADRIDDALNATRSAIEEGYLPGGGISYLMAAYRPQGLAAYSSEDYIKGRVIINTALSMPFAKILSNAGVDALPLIDGITKPFLRLLETGADFEFSTGYNVKSGELEDLYKAGIIDPLKVARVAIENAVSITSVFLTTEAVIAREPQYQIVPMTESR